MTLRVGLLPADRKLIGGGGIHAPGEYVCSVFAGSGLTITLCCAGQVAAADSFVLASPAFKDGTLMPKKHGNNTQGNPNCIGENVSPPLVWSNPPAGTKSFAITMTDPEGRGGAGVVHWLAYGIPASVTSFAEGEASKPSTTYVAGKGTAGGGAITYMGPCTPPGAPHH